jgi:hypothetical protein
MAQGHVKAPILVASASLALGLLAGCASSCGATAEKLATLQRGMSYQEAASIMGCAGSPVSAQDMINGNVSRLEWNGPGSIFTATELDFQNDRLLYYVTRSRTGF